MDKVNKYKRLGRLQARKVYKVSGACQVCQGNPATDIHHIDGDTHNNQTSNIKFTCRSCHLKLDHSSGHMKQQTKLTQEQIDRIKDKRNRLSVIAKEVGLTYRYLQKIRQGVANPKTVPQYCKPVIPNGWEYTDNRGKPRALTVEQVKILRSYSPLGRINADKYAAEFNVALSTIYKAYKAHGCYSLPIYNAV